MREKKVVLVLGNPLDHEGGMVEFNRGLIRKINELSSEYFLEPVVMGSRMNFFYRPILKRIVYPFFLIFDLSKFLLRARKNDVHIIQLNPSLITVPILRDGIVLIVNSLFLKKRTVVVFHGWREGFLEFSSSRPLFHIFLRHILSLSDYFFVLSERFKSDLVLFGVGSEKIHVTTTFFKREDLDSGATEAKTVARDCDEALRLLFLGRVSRLKGVDDLIEALSIVSKRGHGFQCEIVGHGDKQGSLDAYKALIEEKELGACVNFPGRVTGRSKFRLYREADVFILPSYTEGCPTAVIEALASGVFVLSTNVGALNDIIGSHNGIKFDVSDIQGIADAIEYCVKNKNLVRSHRRDIEIDCADRFEVEVVARGFLDIYEKIC